MQDFQGVTGVISFDNGQQIPSKSVSILQATSGALNLVKEVNPQQIPPP
jgi:hypothetical protein